MHSNPRSHPHPSDPDTNHHHQLDTTSDPTPTTHHGASQRVSHRKTGAHQLERAGDAAPAGKWKGKERDLGSSSNPSPSPSPSAPPTLSTSPNQRTGITSLPIETLVHTFAHLPPRTIIACALVCKDWYRIIKDEATWRDAFVAYFGIDDWPGGISAVPGRRLDPSSWRTEYVSRTNLLARWRKPRATTTTHDPRVGYVSHLYVSFPSSISPPLASSSAAWSLSLSLANGLGSLSDPWTGKTSKDRLEADPSDPLGGLGQVGNAGGEVECTAVGVSPDGGKVVWGMRNGQVRVTELSKSGHQRSFFPLVPTPHDGPGLGSAHRSSITAVAFGPYPLQTQGSSRTIKDSQHVATASLDGTVKIWSLDRPSVPTRTAVSPAPGSGADGDPKSALRWSCPPLQTPTGVSDVPVALALDAGTDVGEATLVVGTAAGDVHCWRGIDLVGKGGGGERYVRVGPGKDGALAVKTVHIDPTPRSSSSSSGIDGAPDGDTTSILIHHAGDPTFRRVFPFDNGRPTVVFRRAKDEMEGDLTVVRPDFDLPSLPKPKPKPKPGLPASNTSTMPTAFPGAGQTLGSVGRSTSLSASLDGLAGGGDAEPTASGFGRAKYVVAGDVQGRAYIWSWPSADALDSGTRGEGGRGEVEMEPIRRVQGFECKVTAIELAPLLAFIGTVDGTVRSYDLVTLAPVRTFSDRAASRHPARVLAAGQATQEEEERYAVGNVCGTRDVLVASVGMKVVAFRLNDHTVKGKKRRKLVSRPAHRGDPFRDHRAFRHELEQTQAELDDEQAERDLRLEQVRRINRLAGPPSGMAGLTDDEAVQYAMLLSSEDAERAARSREEEEASFEEELARLTFDDEDDTTRFALTPASRRTGSTVSSRSSDVSDTENEDGGLDRTRSLSPASAGSPLLSSRRQSSRQSFGHLSGTSSPWNVPVPGPWSSSHHKVQISPRPSPFLTATAYSPTTPSSPPPDMSESAWPVPATTSARQGSAARLSTSPTPATWVSGPGRRSWSEAARTASGSPSPSPIGSPSHAGPAPSLLTSRLQRPSGQASPSPTMRVTRPAETDMDADLRYAIELSLAEERSRQDQDGGEAG